MAEDFDDEANVGLFEDETHHLIQGSPLASASDRLKFGDVHSGNLIVSFRNGKIDDSFGNPKSVETATATRNIPEIKIQLLDEENEQENTSRGIHSGNFKPNVKQHYQTKAHTSTEKGLHNISYSSTKNSWNQVDSLKHQQNTAFKHTAYDMNGAEAKPKEATSPVPGEKLATFSESDDSNRINDTPQYCIPLLSHSTSHDVKSTNRDHWSILGSRKRPDSSEEHHSYSGDSDDEVDEYCHFERHELDTVFEGVRNKLCELGIKQ